MNPSVVPPNQPQNAKRSLLADGTVQVVSGIIYTIIGYLIITNFPNIINSTQGFWIVVIIALGVIITSALYLLERRDRLEREKAGLKALALYENVTAMATRLFAVATYTTAIVTAVLLWGPNYSYSMAAGTQSGAKITRFVVTIVGQNINMLVEGTGLDTFQQPSQPLDNHDASKGYVDGQLVIAYLSRSISFDACYPGNQIGCRVQTWSDSKIDLTFGSKTNYFKLSGDSKVVLVLAKPDAFSAHPSVELQAIAIPK